MLIHAGFDKTARVASTNPTVCHQIAALDIRPTMPGSEFMQIIVAHSWTLPMILVVINSNSNWPEVPFTTSLTAVFTMHELRELFSRERVPPVLVKDNRTHFTTNVLSTWTKNTGCRHSLTLRGHPCSNRQLETYAKKLKSSISAS